MTSDESDSDAERAIPEIVAAHFEEFAFLWGARKVALRSAELDWNAAVALENRAVVHLDGLSLAGDGALALLQECLVADDAKTVFAAAYSLLRMNDVKMTADIMQRFRNAKGAQLRGLTEAISQTFSQSLLLDLRDALVCPPASVAVAAAEVLAMNSRLDAMSGRLAELLADSDPAVRRAAWRVVAIVDSSAGTGH